MKFIAMWPMHSGVQQNAESTLIIPNWDAFFFRSPVDSPLYKISWPFSVVLFVLLGANFLTSPLPYSENELGRLRVECSSFETIREQKVFLSDSRARFLAQIESSMHNIIEIKSVGCKSLGT